MKKKHYIIQVGSQEVKVWAENSEEAIEKAKVVYSKRLGLYIKGDPIAWIIDVEEK